MCAWPKECYYTRTTLGKIFLLSILSRSLSFTQAINGPLVPPVPPPPAFPRLPPATAAADDKSLVALPWRA